MVSSFWNKPNSIFAFMSTLLQIKELYVSPSSGSEVLITTEVHGLFSSEELS